MNARQRAVLEALAEWSPQKTQDLRRKCGCGPIQINRALLALVRRGLIETSRFGATYWSITLAGLEEMGRMP